MKMQTVRSILMPDSETPEAVPVPVRSWLPPLTAPSVPRATPAPRPEPQPRQEDLAAKRAGEVYLTMMAGVGYRAQLR